MLGWSQKYVPCAFGETQGCKGEVPEIEAERKLYVQCKCRINVQSIIEDGFGAKQ